MDIKTDDLTTLELAHQIADHGDGSVLGALMVTGMGDEALHG